MAWVCTDPACLLDSTTAAELLRRPITSDFVPRYLQGMSQESRNLVPGALQR